MPPGARAPAPFFAFPRTGLNFAIRAMVSSEAMTRRYCLLLASALAACRSGVPSGPLLPETVDAWRRRDLKDLPPSGASVKRIQRATYEGPGKVEATVYETTSSGASLDMVQRRRPAPDTVFFYRDRYFVEVKWENADRNALSGFVRALEKSLPQ